MVLNESTEMYLEAIYVLHQKKSSVRSIDVAEYLGFSKASVSRAVGLLKNSGYILVEANGALLLTPLGEETSSKIYERHIVLTEVLKALGVDEEVAAENACRIEHVITDEAFYAIKSHYEKMSQK